MSEEKNTLAIEDNRLEEASFVNYEAMSLSELTKELKELLLTEKTQAIKNKWMLSAMNLIKSTMRF